IGQPEVEKDHVGCKDTRSLDRLRASMRASGDLVRGIVLHQQRDAIAHDGVIIDDKEPKRSCRDAYSGTHDFTVTPPSSLVTRLRLPPRRSSRSCAALMPRPSPSLTARLSSRPRPSSATANAMPLLVANAVTTTDFAWACFSTLSSASRAVSTSARER